MSDKNGIKRLYSHGCISTGFDRTKDYGIMRSCRDKIQWMICGHYENLFSLGDITRWHTNKKKFAYLGENSDGAQIYITTTGKYAILYRIPYRRTFGPFDTPESDATYICKLNIIDRIRLWLWLREYKNVRGDMAETVKASVC